MGAEKQGGNTALWKKRVRSWGFLTPTKGLQGTKINNTKSL
jgi:hypothetical protein